ncbi:P-loop containing nucleoside triphosphate hydrolase protein [Auriculariales sp. MPI-PUGE-AT-0066]|nr:P-loop containing nucleoside triphosphate hydrolase protein [Auriculariales sp. MPI-PUGE-AT-0066]
MVNMTDSLPWPLKAVPQTFLQIVQHLEKGQAVAAGVTQLLTEIQAHWDLVAQFHAPDGSDEKISAHVATFFEVLFSVFIRLRVFQAAHPVASRIAVDSYNTALTEESQRVALAMRALESARDWTASNDIADMKKELEVLNRIATTDITIDMDICSAPPPKPNVFHGRDDSVTSLVEKAIDHSTRQAAANLGILGNGGLGKTSLAQIVMWERPIMEHFGPRRFFLSCEPLVDATGVGAALSKLFDIPTSKDTLREMITHLESHSRTLLVLDNLETVWLVPDDRARSQLELLLRRLAAIPTLTLIITSRGVVLPRGIRWANVASASLEPFSAEAALQTFDEISGTSEYDEETECAAVVELMKEVDYMPLAVTLLAQLAQCGEKPSMLLRH